MRKSAGQGKTGSEAQRTRKRNLIERLCADFDAADQQYAALNKVLGIIPESPVFRVMFDALNHELELVAAAVGDKADWVYWYVWENDRGRNGMTVALPHKKGVRTIRTADQLLNLIEAE